MPAPCASLRSGRIEGPKVEGDVKITSHQNCERDLPSATYFPLKGTYKGITDDSLTLWILVYVGGLYWPQSSNPPDQPSKCVEWSPNPSEQTPSGPDAGTWSVVVRLGQLRGPDQFDIVAVLADSQATKDFRESLKNGCNEKEKAEDYRGWSTLPGSVTEMDAITVFTSDE